MLSAVAAAAAHRHALLELAAAAVAWSSSGASSLEVGSSCLTRQTSHQRASTSAPASQHPTPPPRRHANTARPPSAAPPPRPTVRSLLTAQHQPAPLDHPRLRHTLARHLTTSAAAPALDPDPPELGPPVSATPAPVPATPAPTTPRPTPPEPPTFEQLLAMERQRLAGRARPTLDPMSKAVVTRILRAFTASGTAKDQARSAHISSELFPRVAASFRKFLNCAITPELRDIMLQQGGLTPAMQQLLTSYMLQHAQQRYAAELAHQAALVATSDMRQPHTWYPSARALQRRIIYHAGPTNSGKTHNALEALKAAKKGAYLGPLRLLAMEVSDRLNSEGVWCNLVTGQERVVLPGATHTACTTEMADMTTHFDVAVIDEIQLIGCETRGYAWTRALLGLAASEVHLCGDMSALDLVAAICKEAGEELEVRTYERFTELRVEEASVPANSMWGWVRPGDCIVAFSRNRIYEIKQHIERHTPYRACIVYGGLPPETRRQQAQLFNDPGSGYEVLVASDAVGMGLNLNIQRILFDKLHKQIGSRRVPVSVSEIKQIAGRAGRRSSLYKQGYVTSLEPGDLPSIRRAIAVPPTDLRTPAAGLLPEWDQIELLSAQLPGASFTHLLQSFAAAARMDGHYYFCNHDDLLLCARLLDRVPNLALRDRYIFCMAPASMHVLELQLAMLQFAYTYAAGRPVALQMPLPDAPPANPAQMRTLEVNHKILSLWLWLSYRFEEGAFPGRDLVRGVLARIAENLNLGLQLMTARAAGDLQQPSKTPARAPSASPAPGAAAAASGLRIPVVYDPQQWVLGFLDRDSLLDPGMWRYVRRTRR